MELIIASSPDKLEHPVLLSRDFTSKVAEARGFPKSWTVVVVVAVVVVVVVVVVAVAVAVVVVVVVVVVG